MNEKAMHIEQMKRMALAMKKAGGSNTIAYKRLNEIIKKERTKNGNQCI